MSHSFVCSCVCFDYFEVFRVMFVWPCFFFFFGGVSFFICLLFSLSFEEGSGMLFDRFLVRKVLACRFFVVRGTLPCPCRMLFACFVVHLVCCLFVCCSSVICCKRMSVTESPK